MIPLHAYSISAVTGVLRAGGDVAWSAALDIAPQWLLALPLTALRGGVNQVVLFSATGRTLAQRLVWRDAPRREVHVEVRQNASSYAPYAPIVLQVQLRDALGAPIQTDCSLSVRAAESEFTRARRRLVD